MRAFQGPVWAMLSLLVVTTLAGCHGLEIDGNNTTANTTSGDDDADLDVIDDPPGGDAGDTGDTNDDVAPPSDDPPALPELSLTVSGAPGAVTVNESINLTVAVSGDSATAQTAEIAFGASSTASIAEADVSTSDFDGTVAGTPATLTVPGSYDIVNWKVANAGTVYFRAHIVVDGAHHWSDEFSITVNAAPAPPAVEEVTGAATYTVSIGIGGANAQFSPASRAVAVGESVQWKNDDTLAPHTATHNVPEADRLWDSGNIAQGETSTVWRFNAPGTYAYFCQYHPSMSADIVVS